MKKISLKVANMDATEILSKNELKSILGGDGSDGSDGSVYGDGSGGTYHVTCVCNDYSQFQWDGWYLFMYELNSDIHANCLSSHEISAICDQNMGFLM